MICGRTWRQGPRLRAQCAKAVGRSKANSSEVAPRFVLKVAPCFNLKVAFVSVRRSTLVSGSDSDASGSEARLILSYAGVFTRSLWLLMPMTTFCC